MEKWGEQQAAQGLAPAEQINVKGKGALTQVGGMPLVEYTRASLQPCLRCGSDPKDGGVGMGLNQRVVDQVLVMDTVCESCLSDDEREKMERDLADGD